MTTILLQLVTVFTFWLTVFLFWLCWCNDRFVVLVNHFFVLVMFAGLTKTNIWSTKL